MRTFNYIDPFVSHSEDWFYTQQVNTAGRLQKQVVPIVKKLVNMDEQRGTWITSIDRKDIIDFNFLQSSNILGYTTGNLFYTEDAPGKDQNQITPAQVENLLAEAIARVIPSMEQVKLVDSGIKAVNDAIRLARVFTGKTKIVKFDGSIHCNSDQLRITSNDDSSEIISLPFNRKDVVEEAFVNHGHDIAAIIVEPVLTAGVVFPRVGYLQFLRAIATEYQSLLIFDETYTGFQNKLSGAQGSFKVLPDITILAGVLPLGAIGGKHHILSAVVTESAEPLNKVKASIALATLKRLSSPLFCETLNHRSRDFIHALKEITSQKGAVLNSFYSMFSIAFSQREIVNYDDVKASDVKRFDRFASKLRDKDIYLSSPSEANFVSMAHSPVHLNRALEAVYDVLKLM